MRRRRRDQKPMDRTSIIGAVISFLALVLFVLACVHSVSVKGNNGTLVPATGVLLMLLSVGTLVTGFRERKNEAFAGWSRIVGVAVPGVTVLCWLAVYLLGMFFV